MLDSSDFIGSRLVPGLRKDGTDTEWETFVWLATNPSHWLWIGVFLAQSLLSNGRTRVFLILFCGWGLVFQVLNLVSLIILILVSSAFAILCMTGCQPAASYILCMGVMLFNSQGSFVWAKRILLHQDERRILLFDVCVTWISAKGLSLCVDSFRSARRPDIFLSLSYLFYFPSLFTGPVHLFNAYERDVTNRQRISLKNLPAVVFNILKIIAFAFLLHVLLFVNHSQAMQFYPHLVRTLDSWTLCGLGYSLTCLFYLKYCVLYGMAQSLAALDSVSLPQRPACVSRVCQSRVLWRTFDPGLYLWLRSYLFEPLAGWGHGVSSAVTFTVVCIWHRLEAHIVVWCTLNFLSVAVEKYVCSLKLPIREHSLLFAPLFGLMILSNVLFLSNLESAFVMASRVVTFPMPLLPFLVVMYAGCRVSFFLDGRQ